MNMESLIKEMQDPETGVPVRSQKLFLSTIPSAFMGYDLVEWLMNKFDLDESTNVEAINLANLLCQYGYFFPVNDSKNLVLKDDSSLYRFQSPYYWPWQAPRVAGSGSSAPTLGPDNVEYAIYLVKRTLRNKQKHGLEEYEVVALDNLKKNLAAKWEFVTMQAEEQVRLAKERKKGDKIVSDSQERAYWRVARPPPGMMSILEPCPVPLRNRNTKRYGTMEYLTQEIEMLKESLERTRVKTSVAVEALITYSETFAPYDPWMTPPQPSNPWATDDTLFWQINSPLVEVPSEKRVQRWAISIEELVSDPTGLQEFTAFLRKEYSHENIRFWQEVQELRHTSVKALPTKLDEIYQEFLAPGAPCEINIDGATGERARERIRSGSRFALDDAADHVYNLLLKKDCYPRFIRSDHYQRLLQEGKNVLQKKKFFNFGGGGQVKKKPCAGGGGGGAGGSTGSGTSTGTAGLRGRRGSERSLSGSAHELAHCGTGTGAAASTGTGTGTAPARSDVTAPSARPGPSACTQPKRAPHSHSQTNLTDISREPDEGSEAARWGETAGDAVYGGATRRQDSGSSSSELSERRRLPQQSTLDGGLRGAPPPLRRLSAVEPRHMAPLLPVVAVLTAPAVTPVTAPAVTAPAVTPVTRPAPTISVSTPDDDLTEQTDPPSSVFASGDVTPSDPLQVTSDSECSSRDRTLSRQTSTCNDIVISPASCKHTSSAIADLPEGYVDRSVLKTADGDIKPSAFSIAAEAEIIAEKPSVASAVPKLSVSPQTIVTAVGSIATQPVTVVMEERNVEKTPTVVTTDHSVATQAPTTVAAKHSSDGIVTLKASTSEASEHSVAAPELAAPQYDASKAPRRSLTPPAINTVAPLAQGEDSCAEDEPLSAIDFVPAVTIAAVSAPAVTPAAVSAPTVTTAAVSAPTVTPAAVSAPTVTPAAASASEVTPVAVPAVTSASTGDRRNDVCPWEDE